MIIIFVEQEEAWDNFNSKSFLGQNNCMNYNTILHSIINTLLILEDLTDNIQPEWDEPVVVYEGLQKDLWR